ncbi:MAG: hypothetical protein WC022_03270 [Parcubacteria group bacterium]
MGEKLLHEAIAESLKIIKGSDLMKNATGGLLTKKCRHCGGVVIMKGEGVPFEACSSCGKKHYDPVYLT